MKLWRSRLSDEQSERLLEHFVAGTPARAAAALVGVNRNTARLFYHRMRGIIAQYLERTSLARDEVVPAGDLSVDAERHRGVPVFGLFARDGKVHTVFVRDERSDSMPSATGTGMRLDAIVSYVDSRDDRGALNISAFRHRRVDEGKPVAGGRPRIDSIENFWSQAKRHLRRYNGIPRQHFRLFLKECEWRFNYGSPAQLLKTLKAWIKTYPGPVASMPGPSVLQRSGKNRP